MADSLLTDIAFLPLVFSRNRLVHTIEAANPDMTDRTGLVYELEIQVPSYAQSSSFVVLHRSKAKEAPQSTDSGVRVFDGAAFEYNRRNGKIDGLLSYQKPLWKQSKMTTVINQTTPFKLREVVAGGTPLVSTDVVCPTKWAIKAGLSEADFANWSDNFWSVLQPQNRSFLTWQPNNKTIGATQEEYLSFLMNISPKPSQVRLRVQTYLSDGTTSVSTVKSLENVSLNVIVLCPVSVQALALADSVVKYDVWLSDEQNRRLSEVRTYLVDRLYRTNERHILFSNSLGGFDTLRCIGKATETLKVTQTFAQRDDAQKGLDWLEMVVINTEGKRELSVSTGFFKSKQQLEYLDELMLSDEIYLITDKGHVPMKRDTATLINVEDNVDVKARSFSFTLDKTTQNYSDAPSGSVAQDTSWEGLDFTHILDSYGKRTGKMKPARLRKIYQDGSIFKPLTIKPNVEGDNDYIPYLINPSIVVGSTPYPNSVINRLGTFLRNNCNTARGRVGSYATITIEAGKYGSESVGEAQALAELEYNTLNTQDYANVFAECVLNPYDYTYATPANYAHFRQSGCAGNDGVSKDSPDGSGKGNMWYLPAGNDVYSPGTWSIDLPTNYLTWQSWRFVFYGTNFGVKIYVNGVAIYDVAQVPLIDNFYASILIPHAQIPSGARVYVLKTTN